MNAREAGVAIAAAMSPCPHPHREPVTLLTGEHVADLCPDCLLELPTFTSPHDDVTRHPGMT